MERTAAARIEEHDEYWRITTRASNNRSTSYLEPPNSRRSVANAMLKRSPLTARGFYDSCLYQENRRSQRDVGKQWVVFWLLYQIPALHELVTGRSERSRSQMNAARCFYTRLAIVNGYMALQDTSRLWERDGYYKAAPTPRI